MKENISYTEPEYHFYEYVQFYRETRPLFKHYIEKSTTIWSRMCNVKCEGSKAAR